MKKKKVFIALLIMLMLSSISTANAATVFKQCSNSQSRYSWTGLRVYTMDLFGNYMLDNVAKKIVSYDYTHFTASCSFFWSYYGDYSYWGGRDNTGASCTGGANFVLGVVLEENYFGVQNNPDQTYAFALTGQ